MNQAFRDAIDGRMFGPFDALVLLKIMKLSCRLLWHCALFLGFTSASASEAELTFKNFPTAAVAVAEPALPKVGAGKARRFRTVLRDAAPKGPSFAGRFTFVSWGCGVACQEFAIVDAITGDVHFPSELRLNAYDAITDETEPFQFQLDSRLLVLAGKPNDTEVTGLFYYEWTGTDFRLLRITPRTWPR